MAELVFLGTASAVPDEQHENTYMAVRGRLGTLLIDCANNTFVRLEQAMIPFQSIRDIILTHFHPDHVSGLPSLLLNMWLMGRQEPVTIYGLSYTIERMEKLMEFYDWATWPGFYPVIFRDIPQQELSPVLENEEMRVIASPVRHLIPNIGLRIEFLEVSKSLAYSCDTEPCAEVMRLAQGVDVLVHEAAGRALGHTSAVQAGEIAREAGAKALYLIHYETRGKDTTALLAQARQSYSGPVTLAEDFMKVTF